MILILEASGAEILRGRSMESHKNAVDSVPNLDSVFPRLDVDVTRAIRDRLADDEIGKADDRSVFAHLAEFGFAEFLLVIGLDVDLAVEILHHACEGVVHVDVNLVQGAQRGDEVLFDHDHRLDFEPGGQPQLVDDEDVQRIGHRHHKLGPLLFKGNGLEPLGNLGRDQLENVGSGLFLTYVDVRDRPDFAKASHTVSLLNEPKAYQNPCNRFLAPQFA